MTDDSDRDAETKAKLAQLSQDIADGTPIFQFFIDEPLKVLVGSEGELAIDFPWTTVRGYSTAATARAVLMPEAAGRLKAILSAMKNIPDVPPEGRGPRSSN